MEKSEIRVAGRGQEMESYERDEGGKNEGN